MRKKSIIKIGKIIQKIRKSNGLTQEQLAEKLEVSVRYISDIEQDKSRPTYETLISFCNLFNIGMNQIFGRFLTEEEKEIDFSIVGFEKLKSKDKATIENLIMYFNKTKGK